MKQQPSHHPYSSVLRQRAAELRSLASAIERSVVLTLGDAPDDWWGDTRAHLCERLLERNLHQLHQAADDLRTTSFRFRRRAEEFDAAHRVRHAA